MCGKIKVDIGVPMDLGLKERLPCLHSNCYLTARALLNTSGTCYTFLFICLIFLKSEATVCSFF